MLDSDLAELYGVETRALIQAVKRNSERFPEDFVFQLTSEEVGILRSQSVMSSMGHGGRRSSPYAFTEQGVAMLSSVLRSRRAIEVNIAIMRAFVRLREILATNKDLAVKLDELERKLGEPTGQASAGPVFQFRRALISGVGQRQRIAGCGAKMAKGRFTAEPRQEPSNPRRGPSATAYITAERDGHYGVVLTALLELRSPS